MKLQFGVKINQVINKWKIEVGWQASENENI